MSALISFRQEGYHSSEAHALQVHVRSRGWDLASGHVFL